jgi:hypothetical protein
MIVRLPSLSLQIVDQLLALAEEAPMFLLVFAVPAVAALVAWWMLR